MPLACTGTMQKARRITVQKAKQEKAAEPLGIPTHLQILPVSAPVLCVQLASKGGVAHVIAREYLIRGAGVAPGRVATLCPWS